MVFVLGFSSAELPETHLRAAASPCQVAWHVDDPHPLVVELWDCNSLGLPRLWAGEISAKCLRFFFLFADSSGPSSTVSSAGPSSPTSVDNCTRFSFTEKLSISPPKSEEQLTSQSPEQGERQPPGRGLDMEVGMSGLSVVEPSAPETLTWNQGPELGKVLELCKKELVEEDCNPEEKSVVELDEEDSAGGTLEPSNTGNPKCGAGSDIRLAGERVKPGEGYTGGMTGLDQSGLPKEILVPCEEELLGEVLDPEHMGKELLGDSALSGQLLSGHLCQPLSPEKSVEELQPLCQEDQQN